MALLNTYPFDRTYVWKVTEELANLFPSPLPIINGVTHTPGFIPSKWYYLTDPSQIKDFEHPDFLEWNYSGINIPFNVIYEEPWSGPDRSGLYNLYLPYSDIRWPFESQRGFLRSELLAADLMISQIIKILQAKIDFHFDKWTQATNLASHDPAKDYAGVLNRHQSIIDYLTPEITRLQSVQGKIAVNLVDLETVPPTTNYITLRSSVTYNGVTIDDPYYYTPITSYNTTERIDTYLSNLSDTLGTPSFSYTPFKPQGQLYDFYRMTPLSLSLPFQETYQDRTKYLTSQDPVYSQRLASHGPICHYQPWRGRWMTNTDGWINNVLDSFLYLDQTGPRIPWLKDVYLDKEIDLYRYESNVDNLILKMSVGPYIAKYEKGYTISETEDQLAPPHILECELNHDPSVDICLALSHQHATDTITVGEDITARKTPEVDFIQRNAEFVGGIGSPITYRLYYTDIGPRERIHYLRDDTDQQINTADNFLPIDKESFNQAVGGTVDRTFINKPSVRENLVADTIQRPVGNTLNPFTKDLETYVSPSIVTYLDDLPPISFVDPHGLGIPYRHTHGRGHLPLRCHDLNNLFITQHAKGDRYVRDDNTITYRRGYQIVSTHGNQTINHDSYLVGTLVPGVHRRQVGSFPGLTPLYEETNVTFHDGTWTFSDFDNPGTEMVWHGRTPNTPYDPLLWIYKIQYKYKYVVTITTERYYESLPYIWSIYDNHLEYTVNIYPYTRGYDKDTQNVDKALVLAEWEYAKAYQRIRNYDSPGNLSLDITNWDDEYSNTPITLEDLKDHILNATALPASFTNPNGFRFPNIDEIAILDDTDNITANTNPVIVQIHEGYLNGEEVPLFDARFSTDDPL